MCVALPGKVLSVGEATSSARPAVVRFGGRDIAVDLVMVPHASVGDYVVAHAGYALSVIPADEAERTIALMSPAGPS